MRKLNVTILVGIIVAVIGFGLVFAYGTNVDSRVADGKKTQAVLVASSAIAAGATPGQLKGKVSTKQVPMAYIASGALTSLDQVQGEVLLGPIGNGGQLTRSQFGQPNDAGAVKPSAGHVALAVGLELSSGVARYLTPGSIVDVFVTYQSAGKTGAAGSSSSVDVATSRTKLFASGVTILSVSVATPPKGTKEDGGTSTSATTSVIAVLDLTPIDAEKVVNASTLGSIYFALSATDGTRQVHRTPTGATPDDVVGSNR